MRLINNTLTAKKTLFKLSAAAIAVQLCFVAPSASAWGLSSLLGSHKHSVSTVQSQGDAGIPYIPFLNIEKSDITTTHGDTVKIADQYSPDNLKKNGVSGVVIAFITGKVQNNNLVPMLGGRPLTPDSDDNYVAAWKDYINDLQKANIKVLFSFGGYENTADLATLARTSFQDHDTMISKLTAAMKNVVNTLSPDGNVAFDFDMENGEQTAETNGITSPTIYAEVLKSLENSGFLKGIQLNAKTIYAGATIPTNISGPDSQGQSVIEAMKDEIQYVNVMAFDMGNGAGTSPASMYDVRDNYANLLSKGGANGVGGSGVIKGLESDINGKDYALTFMPGDEDGSGANLFMSPTDAANVYSTLNNRPDKPLFTSVWELGRDAQDSTDSTNECYLQKPMSVSGIQKYKCNGQYQSAFAYSRALSGSGDQEWDSTGPYSIASPNGLELVQAKDGVKWQEGYASLSGGVIGGSGNSQTRVFVSSADGSANDQGAAPGKLHLSNFSWVETTQSNIFKPMFSVCKDSPSMGVTTTCFPQIANSLDADHTVNAVVQAQSKDKNFINLTGSSPLKISAPALKNAVRGDDPKIQLVDGITSYNGHDLWVKVTGAPSADWGGVVNKTSFDTNGKHYSAENTSVVDSVNGTSYIHILFGDDERITSASYNLYKYDEIAKQAALQGGEESSSLTGLVDSVLSHHGVCASGDDNCIDNRPGVKSQAAGDILLAKDGNETKYITDSTNLSTQYATDDMVNIDWTPAATNNKGYVEYLVTAAESGGDATFSPQVSENENISITGLTSNQQYGVTITPYVCSSLTSHVSDFQSSDDQSSKSAVCEKTQLAPITGTIHTKAASTAAGAPARIQVTQDPATKVNMSQYAAYDIIVKPNDDVYQQYKPQSGGHAQWPSKSDISTGNIDEFMFHMNVSNEKGLPDPKCTIMNTFPETLGDSVTRDDGINTSFDQSWFTTSAWSNRLWSCKEVSVIDHKISDPKQQGSKTASGTVKEFPILVGDSDNNPNQAKAATANNLSIDLNEVPGLISQAATQANINKVVLTFTSTTNLNVYQDPGNTIENAVFTDNISPQLDAPLRSMQPADKLFKKQDDDNGSYTYTMTLNLGSNLFYQLQKRDGDASHHPYLGVELPFSPSGDNLIKLQDDIKKTAKVTVSTIAIRDVKSITYMVQRDAGVDLKSTQFGNETESRWINYPLWLDNIFREESVGLPGSWDDKTKCDKQNGCVRPMQIGGHIAVQLGFDFNTSSDPTKNANKADIIGENDFYDTSDVSSKDYEAYQSPKAKVFADTSFNPQGFVPHKLYQAYNTKSPAPIQMVGTICSDAVNQNERHVQLHISDLVNGSSEGDNAERLFLPEVYNFDNYDINSIDAMTGWTINKLTPPESTFVLTNAGDRDLGYGGIRAASDGDGKLTLIDEGHMQGLRGDRIPITGAEFHYTGGDLVSSSDGKKVPKAFASGNPVTSSAVWTQQSYGNLSGAPEPQSIPVSVTYNYAGLCSGGGDASEKYSVNIKPAKDTNVDVMSALKSSACRNLMYLSITDMFGKESVFPNLVAMGDPLGHIKIADEGVFIWPVITNQDKSTYNPWSRNHANINSLKFNGEGNCYFTAQSDGAFNPSGDSVAVKTWPVTLYLHVPSATPPKGLSLSPSSISIVQGDNNGSEVKLTDSGLADGASCNAQGIAVDKPAGINLSLNIASTTAVGGNCVYSYTVKASDSAATGSPQQVTFSDKSASAVTTDLAVTVTPKPITNAYMSFKVTDSKTGKQLTGDAKQCFEDSSSQLSFHSSNGFKGGDLTLSGKQLDDSINSDNFIDIHNELTSFDNLRDSGLQIDQQGAQIICRMSHKDRTLEVITIASANNHINLSQAEDVAGKKTFSVDLPLTVTGANPTPPSPTPPGPNPQPPAGGCKKPGYTLWKHQNQSEQVCLISNGSESDYDAIDKPGHGLSSPVCKMTISPDNIAWGKFCWKPVSSSEA